ncbi:MAG TPA: hypothetical protein VF359_06745, partial [Anaerolineales bacterium]
MNDQKQMITMTQDGELLKPSVELESPMHEGMYLPNVQYLEMKKVSNFGGARIRMAKRFWVGGGQARSHEEQMVADVGYLNISRKAIVFAGSTSTISLPLGKIIRVQPYTDGVGVYKEGRQKEYRFTWGKSIDMKLVNVAGDDGTVKPLNGKVI